MKNLTTFRQAAFMAGRVTLAAAAFAFVATTAVGADKSASKDTVENPREMKFKPLSMEPREPEIVKMDDGTMVYLLEDHELPLFSASFVFPMGALSLPSDQVGLAGVASSAWRTGGTTSMEGPAMDEALEGLAASVETDIGGQWSTVSLSCLSEDREKVFGIAADLMENPAFPDDKIELSRSRAVEGVRRQNDNPQGIGRRYYRRALYGKDNRLAAESTVENLTKITRDDIVALHKHVIGPKGIRVAVSGDFDRKSVLEQIKNVIGGLKDQGQETVKLPPVPTKVTPSLTIVPKEVTQAQIRIGHLGLMRHDPDFFAVQVFNEIFGAGGFSSRLMAEIRSNRGLAYGVSGVLDLDDLGGQFIIGSATKTKSVRELYDTALSELKRIREEPVTEEELARAKDSLINSFVFRFDSAREIVSSRLTNDMLGYPPDWLEKFVPEIRKVTAKDVMRVAKEHTHPDQLVVLVVGPEAAMREAFKGAGEPIIQPLEAP